MIRQAFEEWLNPGHHTGNVSPWVDPGRYEKETHQLAWLAWQAATNAALERATKPEEWRAMVYAPLDGTKITLLIRHTTWWAAHKHDPAKANIWEAECEGHWIDFNGGGWTWAGMAGTPIGWRALKDETE